MAVPYLILDGYNLMHAAGLARRSYGPGDLAQCRRRLNGLVRSLLSSVVLARAIMVYDAFDSPSNDRRTIDDEGLHVLFAPKGGDADSEIERLLKSHSSPRQVMVVSGDHRLQKAARRRRSRWIDSEEFLAGLRPDECTETRSKPSSVKSCETSMDVGELQNWATAEEATGVESPGHEFDDDFLAGLETELKKQLPEGKRRNP